MKWKNVSISENRLNGLKLRTAEIMQTSPKTSVPQVLDFLLESAGIAEIAEQELNRKMKKLEAAV